MGSIICGACKGTHSSVVNVRACYASNGQQPASAPSNGENLKARSAAARMGALIAAGASMGGTIATSHGLGEPTRQADEQPASQKQIAFLRTLVAERVLPQGNPAVAALADLSSVSKRTASAAISALLDQPKRDEDKVARDATQAQQPTAAEVVAALTPGVYKVGGQVYIVKPSREDKTRLYAKRLVEINGERLAETGEHVQIEFVYERGAIMRIRPEHRMSLEEGKALTIRYGRCICCGRTLKAAKSVERGIGPVCITYFGG